MNTLIDLDPDPATDSLALLSHMHPHCGFQYRNSYTYCGARPAHGGSGAVPDREDPGPPAEEAGAGAG